MSTPSYFIRVSHIPTDNVTGPLTIPVTGNPDGTVALNPTINNQYGADYQAVAGDNGNLIVMNSANPNTVDIEAGVFPVSAIITVIQQGIGQTTFNPVGVTMNTPLSLSARTQYSIMSAIQVATNIWNVTGDLSL